MGMLDISIVKKYIRMADDGWHQGWHERNGGNLTYRLTDAEVAEITPFLDAEPRPWVSMGVTGDRTHSIRERALLCSLKECARRLGAAALGL